MSNLTQCTECHTANIKFYKARDRYGCIDNGCGFPEEVQENTKLMILFS